MKENEKEAVKLLQSKGYRVSSVGVNKNRYFHKFKVVAESGIESFIYQVSSIKFPVRNNVKKHWFIEFDDSKIKWIEDKKERD